jgi:hypothetical protein
MRSSLLESGAVFAHPKTNKDSASVDAVKRRLISQHTALAVGQHQKPDPSQGMDFARSEAVPRKDAGHHTRHGCTPRIKVIADEKLHQKHIASS